MDDMQENKGRIFYLQVRVRKSVKERLSDIAETNHRTLADVIRAALYFGIPMLEQILKMEQKLTCLVTKAINNSDSEGGRPLKEIFDKFR